jgi:hypothetical protein
MRKLILFFALLGPAIWASAQSAPAASTPPASTDAYHAFKFDVQLGYAIPSSGGGNGTKAGVTFTLEPQYRLSSDLAVGLRLEGAGLGYENDLGKTQVSLLESYCATGEYYFSDNTFRPFVGAGIGLFAQSSLKASDGNATLVPSATNFGFFPEVGFEAGHFRLTADYDVAGNGNNYLAFKIGAFFGGGKK